MDQLIYNNYNNCFFLLLCRFLMMITQILMSLSAIWVTSHIVVSTINLVLLQLSIMGSEYSTVVYDSMRSNR